MELDLSKNISKKNEGKTLNKPFRLPKGNTKKFGVYVRNEKGNVVLVRFGDPKMEIRRDDPDRRKNFRSRHNCSNPGPKTKARYWSCKMWESKKSVTDYLKGSEEEWDGETFVDQEYLLGLNPSLASASIVDDDEEEDDCSCNDDCPCKQKTEAAKRPGRKSGAQTPAKPSERKKGSKKNKPGSAGKKGSKIQFSARVIESLKKKVSEHNKKYSKKVTLGQLKKIYRRGAGAFSSSHRPGKTRGQWAMARVNMFLKMVRGGKVKKSYRAADQDVMKASLQRIERQLTVSFTVEDLILAKLDCQRFGIEHDEYYEFLQDEDFLDDEYVESVFTEASDWSMKRKRNIDCDNPKGFSEKQYCKRQKRGGAYKSKSAEDPAKHMFKTKEEAEKEAMKMGLKGIHVHEMEDGTMMYMPGPDHATFMKKHKEILEKKNESA